METARVIARGSGKSTVKWDRDEQVANRLREIKGMCDRVRMKIEWGDYGSLNEMLRGIKDLAVEALEVQGKGQKAGGR